MSDTIYRPDDTDNKILQKILLKLGGVPRPGDFDNTLYRKILEALGGVFSPGDETNNLLRKIADKVSAHPRPGDTTNKLLYRIVDALHGVPKPGDYDNILLRKILVAGFAPPTPPVLPPAAPVATAATNVTGTSFSANWNAATGATDYQIDVSTSNVFASFVPGFQNLSVGNVTTFSVTGLSNATTYYYRLRASNSGGTSASSNVISTTTLPAAPAAPVATAATNVTGTSFSANWNAATGATDYQIDVSTSNVFASFVPGYQDLSVGNVTTFSVTGLTTATTYYYRVRASNAGGTSTSSNTISLATYDPEVADWVSRVVANGGSVSQSTKDAANTFMLSLKSAGIRTLILRLNLYAGTGLDAARTPLIKDYGPAVDTLTNFLAGNYSEATGLTGNGTTMFNDTGVTITDLNTAGCQSVSYGIYSRVHSVIGALDMGSLTSPPGYTYLSVGNAGNSHYSMMDNTASIIVADAVGTGFYFGSRNATNDMKLYRNGAQIGTTASPGAGPCGVNTTRIFVHAANNANAGGIAFSSMVCGGYQMGNKFNATQASDLYNAWQAFQTALGRQV